MRKYIYLMLLTLLYSCTSNTEQKETQEKVSSVLETTLPDRFVIADTLYSGYHKFFDKIDTSLSFNSIGAVNDFYLSLLDERRTLEKELRDADPQIPKLDHYLAEVRLQSYYFLELYNTLKRNLELKQPELLKDIRIAPVMGFNSYNLIKNEDWEYLALLAKENKIEGLPIYNDLKKIMLFQDAIEKEMDIEQGVVETPAGEILKFKDIVHDKKKTIVMFGASWCTPCIQNDRLLTRWYSRIDTSRVAIVNISIDKSVNKWKDLLQKENYPFENYRLPEKENAALAELLRLNEGIPKIFIFNNKNVLEAYGIDIRYILLNLPEAVRFR